ncbi:MAG: type IX secretion system PorP/SprF family membrane protein [Flavobacteriales bacterium]|jgi:type IX secretion system PorP/SprF family membrane protein
MELLSIKLKKENMKYFYSFICTTIVLLFCNSVLFAQQIPLLNQSAENLNPAYLSQDYYKYDLPTAATLRYRNQWTGIKGAPQTILGSFSHFEEDLNFMFGGDIIHDETGPTGFTGIYGKAGYALKLSKEFLLTVGAKGGLVQYRVRGDELTFLEAGDIANENVTKLFPDFSVGAMLYYDKNYYIGFSVPQVFGLDLEFKGDVKDYNIQRVQHYYGIIGARFDLEDETWLEVSSQAAYTANVSFYMGGRLEFEFRHLFWIAANGSSAKEAGIGVGAIMDVGMNSNVLKFGYTFSNYFQEYGSHFGTVHELGARMSW